jgi:hypothetical protein
LNGRDEKGRVVVVTLGKKVKLRNTGYFLERAETAGWWWSSWGKKSTMQGGEQNSFDLNNE